MLKVSVIIPAYNYANYIAAALDSVLQQTYPAHEIIVVDDGSTDDTAKVLSTYEDRVRVVRKKNAGVAAARNTGMEMATGDLLAFLDADDLWLPRKLERQVQCFEADEEVGLVHCGVLDVNKEGQPIREHLDGRAGWVADEMLFFRGPSVIMGGGSAAMVRRTTQEKIGNFDPALPPSEDWDFYYRCARQFKVAFVPEVLVHYRLHGANSHLRIEKTERAMLLAFKKAFYKSDRRMARLRRPAYGALHMMLAGSYFASGQIKPFVRNAWKSIQYTPSKALYLMQFPLRRLRKRH
jgi:glycosyltransferase involved in cell wall biosynthesis